MNFMVCKIYLNKAVKIYNMPETLLHSWISSTHFEGKFPRQVSLVFLGRTSLQHLEGRDSGPVFCFLLTFMSPLTLKGFLYFINIIIIISFKIRWPR